MNITEGLGYNIVRDEAVIGAILESRMKIASIRDEIVERERVGLMQAGSSDDVASVVNKIDQGYSSLLSTIDEEKMAVAQAAGFFDYASVTDVMDDTPSVSMDSAQPIDDATTRTMTGIVADRSYELRQLDFLIQASKLDETDRFFEWLDPSGDKNGSLGLNLATYIPISKAETQELMDKRNKIEASLIDTTASDVDKLNQFIQSYQLAKNGFEIQDRRVQRHLGNLRSGINFSMSDLTDALQQRMNSEIEMVQAQYGYMITQGDINRLMLSEQYADLPKIAWANKSWFIAPKGGRNN
jgi:hypothetical protein